jgi:hypothetical protein
MLNMCYVAYLLVGYGVMRSLYSWIYGLIKYQNVNIGFWDLSSVYKMSPKGNFGNKTFFGFFYYLSKKTINQLYMPYHVYVRQQIWMIPLSMNHLIKYTLVGLNYFRNTKVIIIFFINSLYIIYFFNIFYNPLIYCYILIFIK